MGESSDGEEELVGVRLVRANFFRLFYILVSLILGKGLFGFSNGWDRSIWKWLSREREIVVACRFLGFFGIGGFRGEMFSEE